MAIRWPISSMRFFTISFSHPNCDCYVGRWIFKWKIFMLPPSASLFCCWRWLQKETKEIIFIQMFNVSYWRVFLRFMIICYFVTYTLLHWILIASGPKAVIIPHFSVISSSRLQFKFYWRRKKNTPKKTGCENSQEIPNVAIFLFPHEQCKLRVFVCLYFNIVLKGINIMRFK